MYLKIVLFTLLIVLAAYKPYAQIISQPNIDFELGNTSVWNYYIGKCCPLVLDTLTAARVNRHEITHGNGVDPFGGFPVVSPEGGAYSFKLGNSMVGAEAERAEYFVHVPPGLNNYSLVFRYAVVFQDPSHGYEAQPRFAVNAFDSVTGESIDCAQYLYVASADLPGFKIFTRDTTMGGVTFTDTIKYKEWTTATINLSGFEGRTVIVQFTSGDCSLGGHFGYGYVDVSGGLFAISTAVCNKNEAVIKGPAGFDKYYWYDSAFTTLIDSAEYVSLPNPVGPTSYAVILKPYDGFGCPDTLYTSIYPSDLEMAPINDVKACGGQQVTLTAKAKGGKGQLSYEWLPDSVSCAGCNSITRFMDATTRYRIKVTDTSGCNISQFIYIDIDTCAITLPNAFTPNGDGKNDVFRMIGIGLGYYEDFSLSIYNRYGQRVFYTTDPYQGWDGIFNNTPQDVGTFFYMVMYTFNGKRQLLKGDVTLVR